MAQVQVYAVPPPPGLFRPPPGLQLPSMDDIPPAVPLAGARRERKSRMSSACDSRRMISWGGSSCCSATDMLEREETCSTLSSTTAPSSLSEKDFSLGMSEHLSLQQEPMKISMDMPAEDWSLGSVGHPFNCNQACKYRNRKGGCRDGTRCMSCHLCQWSRCDPIKPFRPPVDVLDVDNAQASSGVMHVLPQSPLNPMKIPTEATAANWSEGSIGHPLTCADACRYKHRKGGCREGRNCKSCHLCQWSRSSANKPTNQMMSS
mmetsp:Transcript_4580/g.7904  ORF Transcript_4580/g.7904 Transcript_4580/m.7904 type:complete len:262 (-) Transcript_4580:381-1166(-)